MAEFAVFKDAGLVAIPKRLSYEEAATLPCAALTAWHALNESFTISRPGFTVLIQGSGGVSVFALQFAKLAGATVIGTSSSDEKLARLKELGLGYGINYVKNPEWQNELWRGVPPAVYALGTAREENSLRAVDLVIEVAGATIAKSLACLKLGGTISLIGGVAWFEAQVSLSAIRAARARIESIFVGSVKMFEHMNAFIEHAPHAQCTPVIDSVYEFDRAPEALAKLQSGKHFGKIVIRIP